MDFLELILLFFLVVLDNWYQSQVPVAEGAAVPLHIQGNLYTIDFYILTLGGLILFLVFNGFEPWDLSFGISHDFKWSSQSWTILEDYKV